MCTAVCFLMTLLFAKTKAFFFFFSWSHRVRFSLSHQCHLSLFSSKRQITPLRDRQRKTQAQKKSSYLHKFITYYHTDTQFVFMAHNEVCRCPALCNTHCLTVII